ncbi:MAG TPA: hypothetical protein VF789_06455 [Thermoanaerobaculia bacterium]
MKLPIEIECFRKLDLRVGTVTAIRSHPALEGLAIVGLRLDEEAEALAPSSLVQGLQPGSRVVVALGLHPLSAGGLRFTACLMPVAGREGTIIPKITVEIPDGSALS